MVQEQIAKVFDLSPDHFEVIEELASLCRVYDLKPKDLKFKWEAFSFSLKRQNMAPTVDLVRQLRNNLQRELDQKQRKSANVRVAVKMDLSDYTRHMDEVSQSDTLEDFVSKLTGDVATRSTSTISQRISTDTSIDLQASQASTQFANRNATHVLEEQYNIHLAPRGRITKGEKRTTVSLVQEPLKDFYYMFEKIKERGDVQNELLEYMSEQIEKYHGISESVTNPARPYQSEIYTVGRIAWDETEASKLNDKSVVLESSRELGMGKRVKLDLTKLQEYALFPGQVVGIKGVNNTGKQLTVDEFLLPPLPPSIVQKPEELYEYSYGAKVQGQPLEIVVATGPYTLDEDLTYKPLDELISMCLSEKPDVLILLGPFVSETHPIIANGTVPLLPEEVFQAQVSRRLQQLASSCPETRILVVPHPEDAAQEYTMFPQPSMRMDTLGLEGIQTLSNPAMVNINGVVFAITSFDVVLRLGREECAKAVGQADRFSRLVSYLLQQHSFYPLFPPAIDDCIDSERITDLQISFTPDILIVPSQLKHFVKCVDQVLCVNPGRLSRRQTGGTYSKFTIHPLPKQADGGVGTENKVVERTRVEIIKL